MNTYVSLPIFRGLDARGGKKNYEQTQTHTHARETTTVTIIFEALRVSKHVTHSIQNIARGVGIS